MTVFVPFQGVAICLDSTEASVGKTLVPKLEKTPEQWYQTVLLAIIFSPTMHLFFLIPVSFKNVFAITAQVVTL